MHLIDCPEAKTGCLKCYSDDSTCASCDVSKGFSLPNEQGECTCAIAGVEADENGVCQSGCSDEMKQSGCTYCGETPNECKICDIEKFKLDSQEKKCVCKDEGYINDKGNCVAPESNCNTSITLVGCLLCTTDNSNKCKTCDSRRNFKPEPNSATGICECDDKNGFTMRANGECLKVLGVDGHVFNPLNLDKRFLSGDYASSTNNHETIDVTTDNDLNQDDRVYLVELYSNTKQVNINENKLRNLGIILDKETLTINPKDNNQKCYVYNIYQNEPTLTLPLNSEGLTFDNFEKINFEPMDPAAEGDMKIGKIISNGGINEKALNIKSTKNVIVDLIDLYGTKVTVQKSDEESGKLSAKSINVQQACDSTLKDLKITENLNLLQGSKVAFNNVDLENARINVYNAQSENPEIALLIFESNNIPEVLPSRISVFQSEIGKVLEEDNIVLIDLPDDKFFQDTCNKWSDKVSGGDYNQKKCVKEDDSQNRQLVVKRQKDKKKDKLSAGAIAGIVIACVVVVAAIIALLVYFLVIKKKNQSTTSTQGDSSIAI